MVQKCKRCTAKNLDCFGVSKRSKCWPCGILQEKCEGLENTPKNCQRVFGHSDFDFIPSPPCSKKDGTITDEPLTMDAIYNSSELRSTNEPGFSSSRQFTHGHNLQHFVRWYDTTPIGKERRQTIKQGRAPGQNHKVVRHPSQNELREERIKDPNPTFKWEYPKDGSEPRRVRETSTSRNTTVRPPPVPPPLASATSQLTRVRSGSIFGSSTLSSPVSETWQEAGKSSAFNMGGMR